MNALIVSANGIPVGTIEIENGRWKFRYATEWKDYALSPNFPIATRKFEDTADAKPVEWFFENLLPEGRLRDLIAFRDRLDPRDTWALLSRHGQDTAGALSLIPEGFDAAAAGEILVPLAREALQEKIEASRARNLPLMASWDEIRMSLAGAQEKLGLRIDANGAMLLPEGSAPSTHIVKPENASADFPHCPANEFFCMRLAHELKVPVPAVGLLHLPEPLYVIERFDRVPLEQSAEKVAGTTFGRLHQIDLCQALGVAPSKKYESEGGLGLHHLFGVLRGTFIDRPIVAANAVVQWVAFNYLIGNLDAHAKNTAFLMRGQKAVVAPFYDILCVEAYLPRQTMSMAIAGENKPGWVEGSHWDAMAYEAGVAPRLVRGILSRMSADLPEAISRIIGDERLLPVERDFLREKVLPVIEERRGFVADAIKSRQSTIGELLTRKEFDPSVAERLAKLP
ncbi:MAG: HipA domain-containing protein [Rugosibacter sp.]